MFYANKIMQKLNDEEKSCDKSNVMKNISEWKKMQGKRKKKIKLPQTQKLKNYNHKICIVTKFKKFDCDKT